MLLCLGFQHYKTECIRLHLKSSFSFAVQAPSPSSWEKKKAFWKMCYISTGRFNHELLLSHFSFQLYYTSSSSSFFLPSRLMWCSPHLQLWPGFTFHFSLHSLLQYQWYQPCFRSPSTKALVSSSMLLLMPFKNLFHKPAPLPQSNPS